MPEDVRGPVFRAEATVTLPTSVSLVTSANSGYSFSEVRLAMIAVRDELDRIIGSGPKTCPFRNSKGNK